MAEKPNVCSVNFIEKGITVLGPGKVWVSFAGSGPTRGFLCQLDFDVASRVKCEYYT